MKFWAYNRPKIPKTKKKLETAKKFKRCDKKQKVLKGKIDVAYPNYPISSGYSPF